MCINLNWGFSSLKLMLFQLCHISIRQIILNAIIKSGRRKTEIIPLDFIIKSLMTSETTISVEWQGDK